MNPSHVTDEIDDEIRQEIEHEAALILLKSGQVTVSEAAKLRGISRQAVHQSTNFDVRYRRRQYLRTVWTKLIDQLTG
jgi:predicted DNA-binding protein (UPF0251 family)